MATPEIDYTRPQTLDSDTLAGWEALGPSAREAITAQARVDAALFAEEFPGELIDGNWDSAAWGLARDAIAAKLPSDLLDDAADAAGHDVAWGVYCQALHAEVRRLAKSEGDVR